MTYDALFDPGFSKCLTSFSMNIEYFYQELNSIKNFKQKKYQFSVSYPHLTKLINQHIAFYVGCMLWGTYLKHLGCEKILEHPFLGQEYNEEASLSEVNFILEFIQKLDKDTKYYLGRAYKIEDEKLKVLEEYKNFIIKNEGFSKIEMTDKIIISDKLSQISQEEIEKIAERIHETIHTGKLEELLEFCDKI